MSENDQNFSTRDAGATPREPDELNVSPALLKAAIVRLVGEHHISGILAEALINLLGVEND